MKLRIATLNMEQDHKRWALRRGLIIEEFAAIDPDVFAMNEVCLPLQTARWIQRTMHERFGRAYALVQQSNAGESAPVLGNALLTRLPIMETGNLDYRARDKVALVARLATGDRPVDVYVTHLAPGGDDTPRLLQAEQLLAWMRSRDDVDLRVACGDFNATLDQPSAALMAKHFRPTQTKPTAFTALAGEKGEVSHAQSARMDRCIDYIWLDGPMKVLDSKVCFDRPSAADPTLYPSDHAGVWADVALKS